MRRPVTLPELRRQHGNMTQRELAKELGVSPAAVALWETGERVPRLAMVRKIAKFFGLESSDDIVFPGAERDHSSSQTASSA